VPFVPTAVLVVRRRLVDAAAFDESMPMGEDVDFVWRMVDAGWDVRYEPAVRVQHDARSDLRSWARQRMGYGKSAAPLSIRHPGNVAPASLPVLTTAAVLLAARRRPWSASGAIGLATVLAARRLARRVDHPVAEAARLVVRGALMGTAASTAGLARAWGPALSVLVVTGRGRTPLSRAAAAVMLLPALDDWRRSRPSMALVPYTVAHVADDVVYGWGVWLGCRRTRTFRPLVPEVVAGRRRWPASAGAAQTGPVQTGPVRRSPT
jgi:hypothetical protein